MDVLLKAGADPAQTFGCRLRRRIYARVGQADELQATITGDEEVAAALGSENAQNKLYDCTAWAVALMDEDMPLAQMLWDTGAHTLEADLVGRDKLRWTAMEWAVSLGMYKPVEFLLEVGYDVDLPRGSEGRTPLVQAVLFHQLRVAKILLDAGADADHMTTHQFTALGAAFASLDIEMIDLLFERGAEIVIMSSDGAKTPMGNHDLCTWSLGLPLKYLEKLIDLDIDLTESDETGMDCATKAAMMCSIEHLDVMVQHNATVQYFTPNKQPLIYVAMESDDMDSECFTYLEDLGLAEWNDAISNRGQNLLHWSAERGNTEMMEFLLDEKDFDVDAMDDMYWTPFMFAVNSTNLDGMGALHSRGADIYHTSFLDNGDEINAFGVACSSGNQDMYDWMVRKGADEEDMIAYQGKMMTYKKCFEQATVKKNVSGSKKELRKERSSARNLWKGSGYFMRKTNKGDNEQGF